MSEATDRVVVKTTTFYMCACRCGIRMHLRDGEIRYIDGNPEHPLMRGPWSAACWINRVAMRSACNVPTFGPA